MKMYCPRCRRRTPCVRDLTSGKVLCKRCGKIFKTESLGLQKMFEDVTR